MRRDAVAVKVGSKVERNIGVGELAVEKELKLNPYLEKQLWQSEARGLLPPMIPKTAYVPKAMGPSSKRLTALEPIT
ncbi:hypothetical protein IP81_12765 [Novosphingobium sp. AAP83]|nr:hypothetical protein IP81_12765 [Novosphingobium sp. AAP83]